MKLPLILFCLTVSINCNTVVQVSNSKELVNILEDASPGITIKLADGTYHGEFVTTRSGTSNSKITLTGTPNAIITGTNGLHIIGDYWTLHGFSVANSDKGVILSSANYNTLDSLLIQNVNEEGILLKEHSSDNIIQNCIIENSTQGINIGQAVSDWSSDGLPDKSDRNLVLNNTIGPNIRTECVVLNEGSCCGLVRDNNVDGYVDSGEDRVKIVVSVKGDNYTVEKNVLSYLLLNGIGVTHVEAAKVGGCSNRIQNNRCKSFPRSGLCAVNQSLDCSNTFINNTRLR